MFLIAMALTVATADQTAVQAPVPAPTSVAASEDGFQTGVDTIKTVVTKLGRPNSTETNSDGTVTVRYLRVRTHVKGASFVPVIGLFAGGAKGKTTTKSFTFGADGLLKSYSSGDFQTECSTLGGCK